MTEALPLTDAEHAEWFQRHGEEQLRELLFWRWDPIGVADAFPATWDEYDRYTPRIVAVLRAGCDADAVAAELAEIEHGPIGLSRDAPTRAEAAQAIAGWYRLALDAWARRGEQRSSRWRAAGGRRPTRIVPLADPEPPALAGEAPAVTIAGDVVEVRYGSASVTLSGVVATTVGPSRPLAGAAPERFSEVLESPWAHLLSDLQRVDLGPVRHVVLPLGNRRFFECVCAEVVLS
jgi:hypothetical protein